MPFTTDELSEIRDITEQWRADSGSCIEQKNFIQFGYAKAHPDHPKLLNAAIDATNACRVENLLFSPKPESVSLNQSIARWAGANNYLFPGAIQFKNRGFGDQAELGSLYLSARGVLQALPMEVSSKSAGGTGPYAFNPGPQSDFIRDITHRHVAYASGWGGGKSFGGARKLLMHHIRNAFGPDGRATSVKSLVISQNYSVASALNIPQVEEALREFGIRYRFVSDPKKYYFVLEDFGTEDVESWILVRSAEQPAAIVGWEVGTIWGDEAGRWYSSDTDPQADAMLQGEGRLRDMSAHFLQAFYTFTHEGVNTAIYEKFEGENVPDNHRIYRGATKDNKANLGKDYEDNLRRMLSPELAGQYLDGLAANFEGQRVYYGFDAARNADDSLVLNQQRPLLLTFDFNVRPGSHAHIAQYDMDKNLVNVIHEFYIPGSTARTLIEHIIAWMAVEFEPLPRVQVGPWRFIDRLYMFGDASGNNRNLATGTSAWDEVANAIQVAGIPCSMSNVPEANPFVSERAAAMNSAFCNATGEVKFKIHPRCKKAIKDFGVVRWKDGKIDKRDQDVSHASDDIGYLVYQLLPIR